MEERGRDNRPRQRETKQPPKRDTGSKQRVFRRIIVLMLMFGVGLFIPLLRQIWKISVTEHDFYQQKAVEQQTRDVSVAANRGSIYDVKGNVLAMSATVYDLILSPRDLVASVSEKKYTDSDGKLDEAAYQKAIQEKRDMITDQVCSLLDLDRTWVEERMLKTESAYIVLEKDIEGDLADQLQTFITENKLGYSLYLSPTTKRYYPYSSLAAQVIGFCNDSGGAYGLEAWYNDVLEGSPGRVVTTKTGSGTEMYNSYSEYIDAVNGYDLHLTIDATIQAYAEKTLEEGIEEFDVQYGGWCIVMNPKTGAIYAMASSPEYDLNNYGSVTDEKLKAILEQAKSSMNTTEEVYQQAVSSALNKQWRSQAYQDGYEPGSTFKAIVLAAALEEGLVSDSDSFYCSGSATVAGWSKPISCSKKAPGHGAQNLTQAVQHSCNPAFIQIGQRLGLDLFYKYFEAFGLNEPTGIDLPGEGGSNIWDRGSATNVDLAVGSFGQRFTVTPIQMITAFSAVVNGGKLVRPYVVQSITDSDGNIIKNTETTVVRQVVSEQTSRKAASILEQVVSDPKEGTGKNAYVAGYRIGGKTGTSETTVPGEVVVSFMAFAPADDPEVVVLLAYNTPARSAPGSNFGTTGVYISGGNMPAKKVGPLMAEILDYLGVEKQYTAEEAQAADVPMPKVTGLTVSDAQAALEKKNLSCRTVGSGDTVTAQVPAQGASVPGGSTVILYLGEEPAETGTVPDVRGLSYDAAKQRLENAGFFMRSSGYSASARVQSQSVAGGESAAIGTVIDVQFAATQVDDGYVSVG